MSVDANENVTIIKSLENCQIDVGIKKKGTAIVMSVSWITMTVSLSQQHSKVCIYI